MILEKKLKLTKNKKKIWASTKLKNEKKKKKRGALVKWCVSPEKKKEGHGKKEGELV